MCHSASCLESIAWLATRAVSLAANVRRYRGRGDAVTLGNRQQSWEYADPGGHVGRRVGG